MTVVSAPIKILIVEDSPTQAALLEAILEDAQFSVTTTANGLEALEKIRTVKPQMVISDIVMPGMDGFELCKRIKQDEDLKKTPVILLTSLSDPSDIVSGLQSGADNFITKPYDDQYLLSRIRWILANQEINKDSSVQMGVKIVFGNQQHFINAERQQILHLLLSSYEAAVQKNQALIAVREELRSLNETLEQRVQERTEALLRANKLKDEFLATISHELRTPLNAIYGFAHLLHHEGLSEDDTKSVEVILRNAKSLTDIIQDLLDVSGIMSGKLTIKIDPFELGPLIREIVDSFRPLLATKKINIENSIVNDQRLIIGDQTRVRQIAWNLISNAIKFTPENGTIRISNRWQDGYCTISIEDTGIGISPEFLPHVFEHFRQADSSITRRFGGLGLGLTIVRHLAELQGGTVSVTSEGNSKGSTFSVSLPYLSDREDSTKYTKPAVANAASTPYKTTAAAPQQSILSGLHVLVVDDEPDALELLRTALSRFGATVDIANSANEALRTIKIHWPDVFITDLGMPEVDGYTLLKEVRNLEKDRGTVLPAAALTAYARDEDRQRVMASGFQAYISKPLQLQQLLTTVASLAPDKCNLVRPN